MVKCQVVLLDQEKFSTELSKGAMGQELFAAVKEKLQLTDEADYFSLSFKDKKGQRWWLNMDKRIDKQLEGDAQQPYLFHWEVKFYPPVPEYINDDMTRYLVVLQIRKDLFDGRLPASFHTLAILGSYTAQGELGDYDKLIHIGIDYLRKYSFAPYQSEELLMRIADLHKAHRGMTPAEADLYFLQNAKRMAVYGMDMTKVKDAKNQPITVGIAASGLFLYDERLRMEAFKWPRILKISYKANTFYIKVRPGEYEKHEKIVGLKLPTPKEAKRLWRIAVENHQFFRLNQPETVESSTFGTFGSRKWRMSGRTQAQLKTGGNKDTLSSRNDTYRTQDTLMDGQGGYSTGTLPLPGSLSAGGDPRYHTTGRMKENRIIGYDEQGRPIEQLNDSTMSRGLDNTMGTPSHTYRSEEDLLSGGSYDPLAGEMSNGTSTMLGKGQNRLGPDYRSYDDLPTQPVVPQWPHGVGELPLPHFSAESAGIDKYSLTINDAIPLDVHERSEKKVKERDTRLKNTRITVDSNANVDDQMLLDAILAVTGLDPRFEVDKIVIKTEEETS